MKKQDFVAELSELLEYDGNLTVDTNLAELEEYDSLAIMSLVALIFSKFKKKISGQSLANVTKVSVLIELIGNDCFED